MEQKNNGYPPHPPTNSPPQPQYKAPQLSVPQQHYMILANQTGFLAFVKLFELSGYDETQARFLAEKEVYHLANLMAESEDLSRMPPAALIMELRKIPLLGVSLDPALKLSYLLVQDKNKGKVSLEVTGRGKAVQAIAQGIIANVDTQIVYEGDGTAMRPNGTIGVIPGFKQGAKVIGGFIEIQWPNGRITQQPYSQSHISAWQARSAKRYKGTANANYFSFNGGMEPGFLESKMLKHKLDKIGINPLPIKREAIERIAATLPETTDKVAVFVEEPDLVEQQPEKLAPAMDYMQPGPVPFDHNTSQQDWNLPIEQVQSQPQNIPLQQPFGKNYPQHPSIQQTPPNPEPQQQPQTQPQTQSYEL